MKVKVGDTIYESKDQPIMVILSPQDKKNILNMLPECTKYCEYDDENISREEVMKWMEAEEYDVVGENG